MPGGIKRRTVRALDVSLHADLGFAVEGVCFRFCRFSFASLKLVEHSRDDVAAVGLRHGYFPIAVRRVYGQLGPPLNRVTRCTRWGVNAVFPPPYINERNSLHAVVAA